MLLVDAPLLFSSKPLYNSFAHIYIYRVCQREVVCLSQCSIEAGTEIITSVIPQGLRSSIVE